MEKKEHQLRREYEEMLKMKEETLRMKMPEMELRMKRNVADEENKGAAMKLQPSHAGKKMKEILPYNDKQMKLLQVIGFDIADDIPDEHEEDAEFVISRTVEYRGRKGQYTGWMKNGNMEGKGTLIYGDGSYSWRYDGLWKAGKSQGMGRDMRDDGEGAYQGVFSNDTFTNGMSAFDIHGKIKKYVNNKWTLVN